MIQHIQETCGLPSIRGNATVLYEDNVACIAQIKEGFIKGPSTTPFGLILGPDSPSVDEPCGGTLRFSGHWIDRKSVV